MRLAPTRKNYLLPLDETVRYKSVCPGVWRVRLELHASRYRGKPAGGGESSTDAPHVLVRGYHRHRFGRDAYQPKRHELKHAALLLRNHELSVLLTLLPTVAREVEVSYRSTDCHFGAAVAQFERALQKRAERERSRTSPASDTSQASEAAAAHEEEGNRRVLRQRRLSSWAVLPDRRKAFYFDEALERATSAAVRLRLRSSRDFANPPTEVLAVMAADLTDSAEEAS